MNSKEREDWIQDLMARRKMSREDAEMLLIKVEEIQKQEETDQIKAIMKETPNDNENGKKTKNRERAILYKNRKIAKLQNRLKKARVVKEGQEDVCRWIKFEYNHFVRNGRKGFKHPHRVVEYGLQVGNKIYLNNGKFKYRNNKGLKVLKKYNELPETVSPKIKELYLNNCKDNNTYNNSNKGLEIERKEVNNNA